MCFLINPRISSFLLCIIVGAFLPSADVFADVFPNGRLLPVQSRQSAVAGGSDDFSDIGSRAAGFSDAELVGYIVELEALIETTINGGSGGNGGSTPKAGQGLRAGEAAHLLDQLNRIALTRFTPQELSYLKSVALLTEAETSVAQAQEWVNSLDAGASATQRKMAERFLAKNKKRLADLQEVTRQAKLRVSNAQSSLRNRDPKIPSSALSGVVYKAGKMRMRFDYASGLMIPVIEGGGVYLVFKDGLALKHPGAPSDMDLRQFIHENPASVTDLNSIEVSESSLHPPRHRDYRINFYGEFNTPGMGGPTFRSVLLTDDGDFKESTTRLMAGPQINDTFARSVAATDMSGSYFIDGNSIELQYHNGDVSRRVFGTDGGDSLIIGQIEYRTPRE